MCIFIDDYDYRRFIHYFGEVLGDFGIECWNYCVMPNHYHATLQPTRPNLSQALRRLHSAYAQFWNRRHAHVGHVFQGRFKDQLVDRDDYLLVLSRYVVMNPVRAGLVKDPGEWPWSSFRATVGACSVPSFLSVSSTLKLFGDGDEAEQRARFTDWVTADDNDPSTTDRIRAYDRILGSRAFKDWVEPPG